MLQKSLENITVILASGSPRRHQFFKDLEIPFEIRLNPVDEVYPDTLKGAEISDYLAELKAAPFEGNIAPNEIVITSDTVVWHKGVSLAKAADAQEAAQMLRTLSGDWHQVITSICFTTATAQRTVHETTAVKFRALTETEIAHYINNYSPFDKAGAYGIQEWLGHIGIEQIKGTHNNVMGLPTQLLYKTLTQMTASVPTL